MVVEFKKLVLDAVVQLLLKLLLIIAPIFLFRLQAASGLTDGGNNALITTIFLNL
jgi:hypothetical protein